MQGHNFSAAPERLPHQDLDVIVSALADVIGHAKSLQTQATAAIAASGGAANQSALAAKVLVATSNGLQQKLTTDVADAVGQRFDSAVVAAGDAIAASLKTKVGELAGQVASYARTVQVAEASIREQSKAVADSAIKYMALGLIAGTVLGISITCVAAYLLRG